MAKDHGSSVKDDKQYEGLRKKGMSKSRAAAIANAPDSSSKGGKRGGAARLEPQSQEQWRGQRRQPRAEAGSGPQGRQEEQQLIQEVRRKEASRQGVAQAPSGSERANTTSGRGFVARRFAMTRSASPGDCER